VNLAVCEHGAVDRADQAETAEVKAPRARLLRGVRRLFENEDLDPITLRFRDRDLDVAYLDHFFRRNLTNIRLAHLLGIAMWVLWGVVVSRFLVEDRPLDLAVRYGVLLPLTAAGYASTFSRHYRRFFEWEEVAVIALSAVTWVLYTAALEEMPFDFGYVGLILMMTFAYTLIRMRFLFVALTSSLMVIGFVVVSLLTDAPVDHLLLAAYYLGSFWVLGGLGSYALERSTRLLYLRERQLEHERERSDTLLLNILPRTIVERLKSVPSGDGGHLAEAFDEVSVLFADVVDFTTLSEQIPPGDLVEALDRLFTTFDALADRFGLEKIKTVGDAYMAVAGVPEPRSDHAEAAADMGLAILGAMEGSTWPNGEPIRVRIGIASGPAVAGVIGQRKFAYDLWGDTVNLASRLESHGEPGRIMVSERCAARLEGAFATSPPTVVALKGKGPTTVRFLLRRTED
jgi:class 3 adenylate cyclase